MTLKEKPLFYLETHAGKGLYDFKDRQAEKTGEYKEGIQLLWTDKTTLPAPFKEYIKILEELNPHPELRYYPGSPYIAIQCLRNQDRLYLCELHPAEFDSLNQIHRCHKKVHIAHTDGLSALKALLPPPEKRGLIFIDPSYELKEEYKSIPKLLKQAYEKFSSGTFCLWYPVVNKKLSEQLFRGMQTIGAQNTLRLEFNLTLSPKEGMTGCGLYVINAPYTLHEAAKNIMVTLKQYFNPGISSYLIEEL